MTPRAKKTVYRYQKCPVCSHMVRMDPNGLETPKRVAAARWLKRRPHLFRGKTVERYYPMRVSDAWMKISQGLKAAGIYASATNAWDLRIDKIVKMIRDGFVA